MVPVDRNAKPAPAGIAAAMLSDLGTLAGQRAALKAAGIVK
jgi:hypothetical protein